MRAVVAIAATALLLGTACGSTAKPKPLTFYGPYGKGREAFWLIHPRADPKAVVVLLHGLSGNTDLDYIPWLRHLAAAGDDVVYPRYEEIGGDPTARDGVIAGVRAALKELGEPTAPLVLVGHSRGGRLAVEAAAYLKPRAVVAVEPGLINAAFEPQTNLAHIPRSTQIWLLVGDRDHDVGDAGAIELFRRLREYGFPRTHIHGGVIHSSLTFTADHMAPTRADAGTRTVLWPQVDRLIAQAVGA